MMARTSQRPQAARGPWAAAAAASALGVVMLLGAGGLTPARAQADAAALFRDADLALGERLIAEHRCAACHARNIGGEGKAIYRPQGRISAPGFLRGMVEQCNTELALGLFPDEVTAIAAVLNRDHYRFR